jgi:AcrR family transcriptional regulator
VRRPPGAPVTPAAGRRSRSEPTGESGETRRRLLETAAELFADRGFDGVTIREICRAASANLAAVNYHFGDKLALYSEVVRIAIAAMREASAAALAVVDGPPEERLRRYVRAHLERSVGRGRSWIHRLVERELDAPTPALDAVVEQAIRPRIAALGAIVAELLGCPPSEPRVLQVVASIHGQCMIHGRTAITSRLRPGWRPTPARLDELAEHITRFSLGGIRALANP